MEEKAFNRMKEYFQIMEEDIAKLPLEMQEKIYHRCAINCVKDTVLKEHQRQFEECNRDLDLQYTRYGRSDYFFANIIESGHIYEIGYPTCVCHLVQSGMTKVSVHCECSRQSILFVLRQLMPDKKIQVETLETVLRDGERCRFKVQID